MGKRKLNYLFICYANENRSPTAQEVCKKIAKEYSLEIDASSAGISRGSNRPLTKEMADQADKISVMEQHMKVTLITEYGQNPGKIVCLDIPDVYVKNDPWLINVLQDKLLEHLAKEGLL
jgi:predicted protein tyrosine phosphatase